MVAGDVLVYSGPHLTETARTAKGIFLSCGRFSILWAGCFWGVSMMGTSGAAAKAYNAVKCRKHEFLNRISMGVLAVEDGSIDTDLVDGEVAHARQGAGYRQGANLPRLLSSGSVPDDFNLEEQRLLAEFCRCRECRSYENSKTQTGLTSGVALQLLIEQGRHECSSAQEQRYGAQSKP